jgi:hypothetical protein
MAAAEDVGLYGPPMGGKWCMTGTIVGTKLGGLEELNGKFIDVTASFDMDFSCGVK